MPDHPILFNAEMVRALLAGRKTQTRRVVKVPIPKEAEEVFAWFGGDLRRASNGCAPDGVWARVASGLRYLGPSPLGGPGDRLWVREAWCEHVDNGAVFYKADNWPAEAGMKWRSPIHMPRWASRITLEVLDVRAERLQDIIPADVLAEGVDPEAIKRNEAWFHPNDCPGLAFGGLWDSIHGPGAWAANPLVWVYEFEREGR